MDVAKALCAAVLLVALCAVGTGAASPMPVVVDIGLKDHLSPQETMAAQTCIGLANREDSKVRPAYGLMDGTDPFWLSISTGDKSPIKTVSKHTAFVQSCLAASSAGGWAKGYIRYNYTEQKAVVPNLMTLSAVLDAVLLEDAQLAALNMTTPPKLVYDATKSWNGFSNRDATKWMFARYANQTSTMAMTDPGYAKSKHPIDPPLTGNANMHLVDYIVKAKLFNFFLNNACIPLTADHKLMEMMVSNPPASWGSPIAVMGYNSAYPVDGDLFEAETDCVKQHNLGQIASDNIDNLSYMSRTPTITTPFQQVPDPPKTGWSANKTYIGLVIGDGDNIAMVKGARQQWMAQRLQKCAKNPQSNTDCFPLMWSMSPQLMHLAPDMIEWFYNQSHVTKRDYFVLPPSGDLYSYPSMMPTDVQGKFIEHTEHDCVMMDTNSAVAWEWFFDWERAVKDYFPRYAEKSITRGLIAVNVPYMLPTGVFPDGKRFRYLGGQGYEQVVLFKPREWRGTKYSGTPPLSKEEYLSVQDMASEINNLEKGTVMVIYLTSDGGANLDSFYDLVAKLDSHVEIVNQNQAVEYALASNRG